MRKILVPTDFSEPAYNAARYAINLARVIKADIALCHAMLIPVESPLVQSSWPPDYLSVKNQSEEGLQFLSSSLIEKESLSDHKELKVTQIAFVAEVGSVADIVSNIVDYEDIDLVVMGLRGKSIEGNRFIGSNSLRVINKAVTPVILVPDHATFTIIKKIAFATDLTSSDIDVIQALSDLARNFNAEILITHVSRKKVDYQEHQREIDDFMNEVRCKINYDLVYYRHINKDNVNSGLKWLIENSGVDMLVMVHRQRSFFSGLFKSSHTQKLAKHIQIPLLVYPEAVEGIMYF